MLHLHQMYPMTSAALLANAKSPSSSPALGVVTANNHAVTSMADGQLDLFLNRMGECRLRVC